MAGHSTLRLIAAGAVVVIGVYFFAAWGLIVGFFFGYKKYSLFAGVLVSTLLATLLALFGASQLASGACGGLLAFLLCIPATISATLIVITAMLTGIVTGIVGYYLGKWAIGGSLGRRRGISSGRSLGGVLLLIGMLGIIFFTGLTSLSIVGGASAVNPLIFIAFLIGGAYFLTRKGR